MKKSGLLFSICILCLSTIVSPFCNISFAQEQNHVVWDSDKGEITVFSDDFSYGITLQDKNLGASAVGETGDYYQYGNNLPRSAISSTIRASYPSNSYGNSWGGQSDTFYMNSDGVLAGYDTQNHVAKDVLERRGPCDTGYHVPSAGEWNELIKLWCDQKEGCFGTVDLDLEGFISIQNNGFANDMKLVAGGFLNDKDREGDYNGTGYHPAGSVEDANIYGNYWSSSLELNGRSYKSRRTVLNFTNGKVSASNKTDGNWGQNVRCFKNQYMLTLSVSGANNQNIKFSHGEHPAQDQIDNAINQIGIETNLQEGSYINWYIFDGSDKVPFDLKSENVTGNLVVYGEIKINTYTIKFIDEEGNELMDSLFVEWSNTTTGQLEQFTGTRDGYTFKGWKDDAGNIYENGAIIVNNLTGVNGAIINLTAQWEKVKKSGGYSGGGRGGGGGNSTKDINKPEHKTGDTLINENSVENNERIDNDEQKSNTSSETKVTEDDYNKYGKDTVEAYVWAHEKGLTKYDKIEKARLNDPLNRQEMAKISSIFATDILNKIPNESKQGFCSNYKDLKKADNETKFFIVQSCELGYMGYESNGVDALRKFRPYSTLTLAEASTILSRIMWGKKYVMNGKRWFIKHLYAVYEKGLIDDIEDPFATITRGEVYRMLYRTSLLDE